MQANHTDLVRKQTFRIKTETKNDALKMGELSRGWDQELQRTMDEVFSEYPSSLDIKIEKINIDLGNLTPDQFKSQFLHLFKNQLRNTLSREISQHIPFHTTDSMQQQANQPNVQNIPLQVLVYYLEYGHFPWWFLQSEKKNFAKQIFQHFKSRPLDLTSVVLLNTIANSTPRQRFVDLVLYDNPKNWATLLGLEPMYNLFQEVWLLMPSIQKQERYLMLKIFFTQAVLYHLKPGNSALKSWSKVVFKELFAADSSEKSLKFICLLLNSISLNTKPESNTISNKLNIFNKTITSEIMSTNWLKNVLVLANNEWQIKSLKNTLNINKIPSKFSLKKLESTQIKKKSQEEIEVGYMVMNGGILLTWPFLSNLFETLGLTKNKEFKTEKHRHQAVLLLHNFTWNRAVADESELVLEKVICGLEPEDYVDWHLPFPKGYKKEKKLVLNTIASAWSALKTTDGAGIPQTFFQRDAKLVHKFQGWNVAIERKGFDILLNQLPWPISTIKLPWNSELIMVTW